MNEYHKIQTVLLRDPANKHKTLLDGQFAKPEFEFLKDCEWELTEKVDGTNIRVMIVDGQLRYGGKTDRAQIPTTLLDALQTFFEPRIAALNEQFPEGVCFYGEGYGAKIQKDGGLYRDDNGFALFDIKIGDSWLERQSIEGVASAYDIDIVPILGYDTLNSMIDRARDGFTSQWGDFMAEGFIAKPKTTLFNRRGERVITKIKCKDFART